ncbi:ER lumen protein-retaining receptor B [Citrus sinensis]|nr:ER lumen protein-retaining receptor B [Citrus sinensis]
MNIFRLAGDMTHLASVLVLLLKIHTIKSCSGVSLKTQELYALVFATRYLDIFTDFVSLYNTVMKLIFLGSSFSIVWYMRHHSIVRRSHNKDQDTFHRFFLVLPCLLLALLINENFTFKEVMWTFSLYLEAVAILPQLVLLQRTRNIDNLTGQYVFFLGYATIPCIFQIWDMFFACIAPERKGYLLNVFGVSLPIPSDGGSSSLLKNILVP